MPHQVLFVSESDRFFPELDDMVGDNVLIWAQDLKDGLARFHHMDKVDTVLVDGRLNGEEGLEFTTAIRNLNADIPILFLHADRDGTELRFHAVEGDFSVQAIAGLIEASSCKREEVRQQRALATIKHPENFFESMIGDSQPMRTLKENILRIAPTSATVLLTGESGTGKEVTAQAIVQASLRAKKPFIVVNASSIPKELVESELFGHEKGAFTNALKTKKGKFELANGGTIFLDEIGDMPLDAQAKLLRVLESHEVDRVGGDKPIKIDVRVIAATNANLPELVETGKFREDLFYRLDIIGLFLPPLRQRSADIPLLVHYYLARLKQQYKVHKIIDSAAAQKLMNYNWPGNIRQLRNTLERAYLLSSGESIGADDIELRSMNSDENRAKSREPVQFNGTLEDLEMNVILDTLERTNGNKTEAARVLGIGTKTLYRKLEKHRNTITSKK